jgi:hypothetical protein
VAIFKSVKTVDMKQNRNPDDNPQINKNKNPFKSQSKQ